MSLDLDEYNPKKKTVTSHKTSKINSTLVPIMALILIVGVILGFIGGIHYQKNRRSTTTVAAQSSGNVGQNGTNGGFGGGRFGARGGIGSVTAISSSSISVKSQRTSTVTTYGISTNTTVSNNGASASVSDIKIGDIAIVRPGTTDSTLAETIILNPQIPSGGFGGQSQQGAPSPDLQTN